MEDIKRCDSCQGKKTIKGLGNIEKECPSCQGIGWIAAPSILENIKKKSHKKKSKETIINNDS